MNRIDRLSAILIQLQSKKIIKAKEIAARFGITLRTVYRDIRALEEAGIPIGSEPGKGYFIVEGYFLPPVMFTKEEASALILAGKLLDTMSDESVSNEFTSALYKIKSVMKHSDKNFLENLESNVMVWNMVKERYKTNKYLLPVKKAVADKRVIKINYISGYELYILFFPEQVIIETSLEFYFPSSLTAVCRKSSFYQSDEIYYRAVIRCFNQNMDMIRHHAICIKIYILLI